MRELEGLRILVLEDEFLIAMDVEQVCRDHGAVDVVIKRSLSGLENRPVNDLDFDAAVLDMRLGTTSTLDFARSLLAGGIPFVFATGYGDPAETAQSFPGVPVITKPYMGSDLVEALVRVVGTRSPRLTLSR